MEKKMNKTDKAIEKYCDMMIKRINELKEGWRKTWLSVECNGEPVNADGRKYNSMNAFMLYLITEFEGYRFPVFVTYNKAKQLGAHVKKGETSFPVIFWKWMAKTETGEYIDAKDAGENDKVFPILKTFDVFNVDQTTIEEDAPEWLAKLQKRYTAPTLNGTDGMYVNEQMDALIGGEWVCPIHTKKQDCACYSPAKDVITLPTKEQFNDGKNAYEGGMEFYAAALHEMAHSTGSEKRLNRTMKGFFGGKDYGREELVAELTAAICGHNLGFNTRVQDNNAAYLSSWLKQIKEEPKYLVSVLSDVSKAVGMIESEIAKVG